MEKRVDEVEEEAPGGEGDGRGLPAGASWCLTALIALFGFLLHHDADFEFRSDDVALIVQGSETSVLGGVLRAFARPFAEIQAVAFYRPLFSIDFMLMGKIVGDDARLMGWLNLGLLILVLVLGHRALLALGLSELEAALGSFVFAAQPWVVNNVAWLVGRSTLIATITILAVFLLDRRASRAGRPVSPCAVLILGLGVFYRETAAMVLPLILLHDLSRRVPLRPIVRRLVFLSLPVLVHLALRYAVLGQLVGGYEGLDLLRTGAAGIESPWNGLPETFMRLLSAGPGDLVSDRGWRVFAAAGLSVLALLAALLRRGHARGPLTVLALFALVHALPLVMVESSLHAGSSQRWHSVLWAFSAILGIGFARLPQRSGVVLAALLVALMSLRLRENLDDYERSSACLRSLRQAIERSAEPTILVHGLVPYVGCAPFFEIGVGQLLQEPFSDGTKSLFPLAMVAAHGGDARRTQTPLAVYFARRGEAFSPVWLDLEAAQVVDMEEAQIEEAAQLFDERPRLSLRSPVPMSPSLRLDLDVGAAERLEIHFIAPLAEFVLHRERGAGLFAAEASSYEEDLSGLREIGLHLDGQAQGRCFLWIAAYDSLERGIEPAAVSEIIEIHLRED